MSAPNSEIIIRASATSAYPDCPRREAAKGWPDIIEAAGFTLRTRAASVGAVIGTSVHTAAEYTLKTKLDTGELGNDTEAEDRAIARLEYAKEDGIIWDDTSPGEDPAKFQIARMTRMYRRERAPEIQPIAVEKRLGIDAGDGFTVSGKSDLVAIVESEDATAITDLKTGVIERVNIAQLGTYSLIERSHGRSVDIVQEDFLQRVNVKKPQPAPVFRRYEIELAEQVAEMRINQMKRDATTFLKTQDPQSFPANPMSMLCSPKYCPAYGSDFCREHKEAR